MPHKTLEARRAYLVGRKEHNREVHRVWAAANREHRKAYGAAHRAENREHIRAEDRRRYHENLEAAHQRSQKKYAKNAERIRLQARAKRAADPEAARAKDRARRLGNPEVAQTKDAERRQKNGTHIDAMTRARRLANPEPFCATDRKRSKTPQRKAQFAAIKRTRHAQKKGAPLNDLTHHQWIEIQEAQNHCCASCGKRCKGKLTQDHIQPLSKGGSHTLHNVIAVCRACNSRKGTRPAPKLVQPLLLTVAPSRKKKAS